MQIIKLKPLSVCDTNSYIVSSDESNTALIDAPDNPDYILSEIEKNNLNLKMILLTHGHFDHVGAVAKLAEKTGCDVYIHEADFPKLLDVDKSLVTYFGLNEFSPYKQAKHFKDGDTISLDELTFKIIHTPGHTSGSVCITIDDVMFSGDTLFAGSIGRTDLPDGNSLTMISSLKKLAGIDKNYIVYPGHMSSTTLDDEKTFNPYMTGLIKEN